jgi:hypothetical protein
MHRKKLFSYEKLSYILKLLKGADLFGDEFQLVQK